MEGRKWSLSTGVDSGTFTCIEGSAPRHAWELGGWVTDCALWDLIRQMHTIGRIVVIYTTQGIYEMSIVMKIFLLYFRY